MADQVIHKYSQHWVLKPPSVRGVEVAKASAYVLFNDLDPSDGGWSQNPMETVLTVRILKRSVDFLA